MKKVLSMVAALLLCVGTQAQIVSSRSAIVKTEKQASSTQWFLRAGLNIMNFSGDGAEGADSNIGYNATFGYQKPLGSTGGYFKPLFDSFLTRLERLVLHKLHTMRVINKRISRNSRFRLISF